MKLQIKYAIRKFVKSKYTLYDLVQEVADPEIIPPITSLLSGSKSNDYSRTHIPGIHKALVKFFTKKNSYIPTFRDDND
eukprot:5570155-Ditylum_brightwellii.AAC.1